MPTRLLLFIMTGFAVSVGFSVLALLETFSFSYAEETPPKRLDPAAWGSDHVGKPVPEFMTGDECLFCHRMDVGPSWPKNRHQTTIRSRESEPEAIAASKRDAAMKRFAEEVEFVLGSKNRIRFLKRAKEYGRLELLSVQWQPPRDDGPGKLIHLSEQAKGSTSPDPHWDAQKFGNSCAGCHTTGVDHETQAFSSLSLDCFTCHGDVALDHTKDPSKVILSKERGDLPRVVTSICAQCHLRTGKSRSTGSPYPNNFVAGDNLFLDFRVDWSDEHLSSLNPADRHVLENVRNVAVFGESEVTCLSCHTVHEQSSQKHQQLADRTICQNCHNATGPKSMRKRYDVHSEICGY